MIENTLFLLGSFFVAWLLGHAFNALFERLFPEQPLATPTHPEIMNRRVEDRSLETSGLSPAYKKLEWL